MDVSLKSLETGFSWKKTEEINGVFNLETLDSETYQNDGVFGPLKTSGWNHRKLLRPSEFHKKGAVASIAAHVMQKENKRKRSTFIMCHKTSMCHKT